MRQHAHLPAMVSLVRKHVAQHFHANRPRASPAVSEKLLDAAPATAERLREHLHAASGALGQSLAGLLPRTMHPIELGRNFQVRSCEPDPLSPDIVHVGEDRRNGAGIAGRFCRPGRGIEILDEKLVYAIIGGEDLDCGSAELSVNLGWTKLGLARLGLTKLFLARGHGSVFLDLIIRPRCGKPEVIRANR